MKNYITDNYTPIPILFFENYLTFFVEVLFMTIFSTLSNIFILWREHFQKFTCLLFSGSLNIVILCPLNQVRDVLSEWSYLTVSAFDRLSSSNDKLSASFFTCTDIDVQQLVL